MKGSWSLGCRVKWDAAMKGSWSLGFRVKWDAAMKGSWSLGFRAKGAEGFGFWGVGFSVFGFVQKWS